MKIFFVRTPWEKLHLGFYKIANFEPLALEYLSTAVKDLAEVNLWDLWFEKEKKLYQSLKKHKPEILAMSVCTIQIYSAARIAERVKKISPETVVVVGGDAPTLTPGFFRNTAIDLIIVGNGADTFRKLVLRILSNADLKNIEGTIQVCGKNLHQTIRKNPPLPIDYYGTADRKLTEKYRAHFFFYHHKPVASTIFSKGCWNRCNFCVTWMKDGYGSVERREVQHILEDLQNIEEKWIFICDDDTFANGHKIEQILQGIEKLKINHLYMIEATSDDIIKNEKVIEKWAQLGLRKVLIGLESPFDVDLKSVSKAANVRSNKKAIQILRKYGVDVIASFILFDYWTAKKFRDLWKFVKENKLFWVHYQAYTPLPGSKLYVDNFKKITNHNLDLFDEEHMLLKTKISLFSWYLHKLILQFKTGMPHRGFDKQVHREIPQNPFHPIYRAFLRLLLEYSLAYFHHFIKPPKWQSNDIESILSPGPSKNLYHLRSYNYLSRNNHILKYFNLNKETKSIAN